MVRIYFHLPFTACVFLPARLFLPASHFKGISNFLAVHRLSIRNSDPQQTIQFLVYLIFTPLKCLFLWISQLDRFRGYNY